MTASTSRATDRATGRAAAPVIGARPGGPAGFAVVIPAHNEEDLVGPCLRAVQQALARSEVPSAIVLVAHRCTDRTAQIARELLTGPNDQVLLDDSPTVATARAAGAALAVAVLVAGPDPAGVADPVPADRCWLLSTDADSEVPPTWLADLGRHIDRGVAAVAGLVRVHGWEGASPAAREAYRAVVAARMRMVHHEHAYAANLAVRLDAYLDVGGWPNQVPGEDEALLAALRARGWPVAAARDVWVRTSGRRTPRAAGGLGSLLDRLAGEGIGPALDIT